MVWIPDLDAGDEKLLSDVLLFGKSIIFVISNCLNEAFLWSYDAVYRFYLKLKSRLVSSNEYIKGKYAASFVSISKESHRVGLEIHLFSV